MPAPIAILTDFGNHDPYVGIMKGVILKRVDAPLIDLTHEIPPGDIRRAAFALWQSYRFFPEGTIFLAVVDPGVGSSRLPVLVESEGYRFVAPDNGLLTYILQPESRAWALANPAFQLHTPSATFHGRDIFAPAAAYAALGVPGRAFGPMVPTLQRIPLPRWEREDEMLHGEVLHTDRFGNLITSLGVFRHDGRHWLLFPWLSAKSEPQYFTPGAVRLPDGKVLPLVRTFSEVPDGEVAALIGSSGMVEIVANRHSAADILGLKPGTPITLLSEAFTHAQHEETA